MAELMVEKMEKKTDGSKVDKMVDRKVVDMVEMSAVVKVDMKVDSWVL